MPSLAEAWTIDPEVVFLNHGSFGACPARVLEVQSELRLRMERELVLFLARELEGEMDVARADLALFLGAVPEDIAAISNATGGVNAVLRSLDLASGDEILVTDHGYNACRNAAEFVAGRSGARVVVARLPFPLSSPDEVVEAVLGKVTNRTRLLLIDHVTSPTAMVLPIERIIPELRERGIETLVDGAHAPGMLPLDLGRLDPGYYTGNCHKWICAPKGAAFLYVRRDLQPSVRPVVISHGANSARTDRSRFLLEFDWVGTDDPTAWLCVPEALRVMDGLVPGGWDEVRWRNRELVLFGRDALCTTLGVDPPVPDSMIGSLATVPLPASNGPAPADVFAVDPLQAALFEEERIEVPIHPWPAPPERAVRISAQLYNEKPQYERLAEALKARL